MPAENIMWLQFLFSFPLLRLTAQTSSEKTCVRVNQILCKRRVSATQANWLKRWAI